jgi:hypothetical protein
MSEPVSFDRDAWLYPYYAALKRDQGFARLAPVHHAKALADAVQADYPAKAAEIRDWKHATSLAQTLRKEIGCRHHGALATDRCLARARGGVSSTAATTPWGLTRRTALAPSTGSPSVTVSLAYSDAI